MNAAAEPKHRYRKFSLWLLAAGLALAAAILLWWSLRDLVRSPAALYGEAQAAAPARAAQIYRQLGERLPEIEEYARLWTALTVLPGADGMETLHDVVAHRPQSPAAYLAHLALARVYASQEAPEAEAAYRAALALDDAVAVRLELARFLEAQGRPADAYVEYRQILGKQPDAFTAMRRTGQDPLAVARDLVAATYNSDALETLRGVDDPAAQPIRAQALAGLGRHAEAEDNYRAWLADHPDDEEALLGLAGVLTSLERPDDALAILRSVDNDDSRLAQADLLRATDAGQALQLYQGSPYPVAWWSATSLLEEQGRLTETLPIYARLARTDTPLADDAAYRLFVLGDRVGDADARAEGGRLLDGFGLDWLALRAQGAGPSLAIAPPMASAAEEILAKVDALDTIGRSDLARMELLLAARSRRAPEADLAVAQALAVRGQLLDAQSVAEKYTAEHPRAPREFWELSYPRPYSDTVQAAAAEFGIDPFLVWAVMREESRFDPDALSFAGARGLMQLMPDTQDWIAGQLGNYKAPGDAYEPAAAIRMGAWLLSFLSDYYDGDLELAIPAYNAGAGSVDIWQADARVANRDDLLRWIGYDETRRYLEQVALSHEVYKVLYGLSE